MSLVKRRQQKALQSATETEQKKTPIAKAVTQSTIDDNRPAVMADFDLYKVAIDADLAQLKQFPDIDGKCEYKAQAIEQNDYMGYLNRYRDSGANHPNAVIVWLIIWLVDLGRWSTALEYLPMLIEQEQKFPKGFRTLDWPTFFIDQLYDEGAKHLAKGRDVVEKTDVMQLFVFMTTHFEKQGWVVHELVGGKLFSMAAKLENAMFNYGNAYRYCVKATEINDKAGVKKLAKELAIKIGKTTSNDS